MRSRWAAQCSNMPETMSYASAHGTITECEIDAIRAHLLFVCCGFVLVFSSRVAMEEPELLAKDVRAFFHDLQAKNLSQGTVF